MKFVRNFEELKTKLDDLPVEITGNDDKMNILGTEEGTDFCAMIEKVKRQNYELTIEHFNCWSGIRLSQCVAIIRNLYRDEQISTHDLKHISMSQLW